MPCEHMGVLLSRYVDGEASTEDRRVVEGHVRECADCKKELEVFRRNEALLAQAFSEEVAGEAFIADVLAKAGLVPSRPGPLRRRLTLAAGSIAAFFSVPARAVAAVLLALSGFLAWSSYTVHKQNDRLIGDVEDALTRLQKSNDQNHDLLGVIRDIRLAIAVAMAQPEKPTPVEIAHGPSSVPPQESVVVPAQPAEQREPVQEVKALLPTDFFHSIFATSWEKGVWLSWETKPAPGKVAFNVYRQDASDADFHGPLNESPIVGNFCYLDESARPASSYAYQVEAVPEKGEPEKSRVIEIHTLGNLVIHNNGVMTVGTETRSLMDVRRYVDGRWVSAIFEVAEGQPIGRPQYCKETKGVVDFTTGCVLRRITEEERDSRRLISVPAPDEKGNPLVDPRTGAYYYVWREVVDKVTTNRVTVVDESGKEYKLWKGEGRRGTLGSLE